MKLRLTIEIPDSANPYEVRQALTGIAWKGEGLTLQMPSGWLVDVDLISIMTTSKELV